MHHPPVILKAALLAITALLSTAGLAEDGKDGDQKPLWLKEYTPGTSPYTPNTAARKDAKTQSQEPCPEHAGDQKPCPNEPHPAQPPRGVAAAVPAGHDR
jgi:hypothetical protein